MFMTTGFETGLCRDTGAPCVLFHFANGWTGSLVMRMGGRTTRTPMASVVAWLTDHPDRKVVGPTQASADCAIAWLDDVRMREVV
ncbi:hypothetical protein [Sphingobium aromaticiconvertens]|uniref:hypothetical protein n=1 Tax=Sphingobium aromaticiconvertens TaxID=365341 RepID=UPI00301767BC